MRVERFRYALACVAFGAAFFLARDSLAKVAAAKHAPPEKMVHGMHLTISRATTFITQPLKKDGLPDYAAALALYFRKGVTPGNNAAAFLFQTIPPAALSAKYHALFYHTLGIPPPMGASCLRVPERANRFHLDLAIACQKPWRARQHPWVARYLNSNGKILRLWMRAGKLPKFYVPVMRSRETGLLMDGPLPGFPYERFAWHMLVARAMLEAQQRHFGRSQRALAGVLQVAARASRSPLLLYQGITWSAARRAADATIYLASHKVLPTGPARLLLNTLNRLPRLRGPAFSMDRGTRFFYLDYVTHMAGAYGRANGLFMLPNKRDDRITVTDLAGANWNIILRAVNRYCNAMVAAFRQPTFRAQMHALETIDQRIQATVPRLRRGSVRWQRLEDGFNSSDHHGYVINAFSRHFFENRGPYSRRIAHLLLALMAPPLEQAVALHDRSVLALRIARTALALRIYEGRHGRYPARLRALSPQYLPGPPENVYTNRPLHYTSNGETYKLWANIPAENQPFPGRKRPKAKRLIIRGRPQ